jgi:hypothetical protein
MTMPPAPDSETDARLRAANRRTAVILGSIASLFFVGVIAVQFFPTPTVSIAVLGTAVLGYLVLAIGRNLRR